MEKLTKIKFYAGMRTIGGTIVCVSYGDDSIIFDFGRDYRPLDSIVQGGFNKLKNPVGEYIRMGILPHIDYLYGKKEIEKYNDIKPALGSKKNIKVFISHLHLDHMELMGLIDESVPVIMTKDGLNLYNHLEKIGEGIKGKRKFQSMDYNETVCCGDIKVTALRVEHDVLGACSFFIQTPDLNILYTGDLRTDGAHPEWTSGMIEKANEFGVDLLMIEGTNIRESIPQKSKLGDKRVTEGDIKKLTEEEIKKSNGVAFFNIYHRNLERISELYEAAKGAGRKLVLEPKTAYLAKDMLKMDDFLVLDDDRIEKISDEAEKAISDIGKVSIEKINSEPLNYFIQNSFENLLLLLDIDVENGVYIHSNGSPLGDYDPNYGALKEFLNKLPLKFKYIGASGHAKAEDLRSVAEKIAPDWFIPLHSFHPENFVIDCGIRLLPEYGREYKFKDGNLIK